MVVIGAGVAGCAAALHLARRGHRVVVLERGGFPREKVCGEGLMPHGVAELRALGITVSGRPFPGIAWHHGDAVARGDFPAGAGLGVRRYHLDALLASALAEEPGVTLHTGVRAGAIQRRAGEVVVQTDQGEVRARALVGADGRGSRVRRHLGLEAPASARPRYGIRAHYRLSEPPPDRVEVHVGPEAELYLTPTGAREINVAVLCGRETTRALRGGLTEGFERLVRGRLPLLEGAERLTAPAVAGPLRQAVRSTVADRAVLVGDAAGFVDAITGEGMALSLLGARLAAELLDEGLRTDRLSAHDLAPHDRRWRRRVRDPARMAEVILWGLRRPRLAKRVVRNLARHPELFGRLLAVQAGQAPLTSLRLGGLRRLLVGA